MPAATGPGDTDRRVWPALVAAAGVAARSFVLTLAGVGTLAFLLAIVVWALVDDTRLAAVLALLMFAAGAAAAIFLACKRAVLLALRVGVGRFGLSRHAFDLVLAGLRRIPAESRAGVTADAIGRGLERLPLDRAEAGLREAIATVARGDAETGWLRRLLRRRLLGLVETVTLAHLRRPGSHEHGVNLALLEQELGTRVDQLVLDRLSSSLRLVTALVLLALVTLAGVGIAIGQQWS